MDKNELGLIDKKCIHIS